MKTGVWISLILLALTIGMGVWSGEEMRALSEEYAGRVTFGKLNIDENANKIVEDEIVVSAAPVAAEDKTEETAEAK